jgi:hypothetical protein
MTADLDEEELEPAFFSAEASCASASLGVIFQGDAPA